MTSQETQIAALIKKAAEANEPLAAMQYSQAAVNAANAWCASKSAEKI
jgi:hypothetical protein